MGSAIGNEGPVDSNELIKYAVLNILAVPYVHSTNLSTGPPRPPRPPSYFLLFSGSQIGVNKDKGVSVDVKKRRRSVLLTVAAKLRVVAERDL